MASVKYLRRKAGNEAWEYERSLVEDGYGTRDWTPEQQEELLNSEPPRVEGFEAHHMTSVKADSELAGDYENIQFLTREEHQAAHDKNFQNTTEGEYYDAEMGKVDLGGYAPGMKLSNPIAENEDEDEDQDEDESVSNEENENYNNELETNENWQVGNDIPNPQEDVYKENNYMNNDDYDYGYGM